MFVGCFYGKHGSTREKRNLFSCNIVYNLTEVRKREYYTLATEKKL